MLKSFRDDDMSALVEISDSRVEDALERIHVASSSGQATLWRRELDALFSLGTTHPAITALKLLDGVNRTNLIERYRQYRRLGLQPLDHPVFAWSEICFAANTNDVARCIDLAEEASAKFPHRYELVASHVRFLSLNRMTTNKAIQRCNQFLEQFHDQHGAWHAAALFSRSWKGKDFLTQFASAIHSRFPETNVGKAIQRDLAVRHGNLNAALTLARDVVAFDPDSGLAWYELARIEKLLGHNESAARNIELALRVQPFNPDFLEVARELLDRLDDSGLKTKLLAAASKG